MVRRRLRLAQRRKAVGLSQEQLAYKLGVDRSTVVRWERADTDPQPWHRPRLAAALKVSVDELSDLLENRDESRSTLHERLAYALRTPRNVDLVTVAYLREQVERLDEQYERVPSTLLLADAGQLHGQVVLLRQSAATERTRRELWAAEAESATLVGQLVWDASQRRHHESAVRFFDQAINAATQTRDATAEANGYLRKSYIALYGTGNPRTGLALAERAATASEHSSHVIAGLAKLHVGEACAAMGDPRGCDAALGQAETHFARIETDDPAAVLFCPSQFSRMTGSCLLSLGRPDKAEAALEEAHQGLRERKKSTAIVLGNLALANIRQRDLDTATAHLHDAIDVVEQTRSGGGLNVVFEAARELRPWRDEPAVQDISDRLFTLMTAA